MWTYSFRIFHSNPRILEPLKPPLSPLKKHHDLRPDNQYDNIFGPRFRLFFERRYLKRNPTQSLRWSYFQGFTPQNSWQNIRAARKKQHFKPLKIRPHATKPIDIVLRRTAGTITNYLLKWIWNVCLTQGPFFPILPQKTVTDTSSGEKR